MRGERWTRRVVKKKKRERERTEARKKKKKREEEEVLGAVKRTWDRSYFFLGLVSPFTFVKLGSDSLSPRNGEKEEEGEGKKWTREKREEENRRCLLFGNRIAWIAALQIRINCSFLIGN